MSKIKNIIFDKEYVKYGQSMSHVEVVRNITYFVVSKIKLA